MTSPFLAESACKGGCRHLATVAHSVFHADHGAVKHALAEASAAGHTRVEIHAAAGHGHAAKTLPRALGRRHLEGVYGTGARRQVLTDGGAGVAKAEQADAGTSRLERRGGRIVVLPPAGHGDAWAGERRASGQYRPTRWANQYGSGTTGRRKGAKPTQQQAQQAARRARRAELAQPAAYSRALHSADPHRTFTALQRVGLYDAVTGGGHQHDPQGGDNPLSHREGYDFDGRTGSYKKKRAAAVVKADPSVRDRLRAAAHPAPVERRPVNSSAVASMGYQPQTRRLAYEMRSRPDAPYTYRADARQAQDAGHAPSVGRHYAKAVRGKLPRKEKVTPMDRARLFADPPNKDAA